MILSNATICHIRIFNKSYIIAPLIQLYSFPMPETQSRLIYAAGLVVLLAVVVAGPYMQTRLEPDAVVMKTSPCDLQKGSCTASWENMSLTLAMGPTPLIALKPIDVSLVLKGAPEQATVKLSLQGAEMYMGEIRSTLSSQLNSPELFKGQTYLSICTDLDMIWRATVYIETPTQLYAAHFNFAAQ